MSGLTSYPRTTGGGGSNIEQFRDLLNHLQEGTGGDPGNIAENLVMVLERMSAAVIADSAGLPAHQTVVKLCVEAREALYKAKTSGMIFTAHYQRAMEICSLHWITAHPTIEETGLKPRLDAAMTQLRNAQTAPQLRAAKEELGIVAWLYQASALLGEDIATTAAADPAAIPGSRYLEKREDGELRYLQCAGPYNVNVYLSIPVTGSASPMVMVGEAKGGKSGYGTAITPQPQRDLLGRMVHQRDPGYAASRAFYMERNSDASPVGDARRAAGAAILLAWEEERMVYVTARGEVEETGVIGRREVFRCD